MTKENENLTGKLLFFIAVYLLFAKPIMNFIKEKLGMKDTQETKDTEQEALDNSSPFKPDFWRRYMYQAPTAAKGRKPVSVNMVNRLNKIHKDLKACFGYLSDNDEGAFAQIGLIRTQSECSYLAAQFAQVEKKDLLEFLRTGTDILPNNGLDDKSISKIIARIKKLPLA